MSGPAAGAWPTAVDAFPPICMLIASEIACRDLRQARGQRLGALQRKFPVLGLSLLYVLAALELFAFPLLGAGTAGTTR